MSKGQLENHIENIVLISDADEITKHIIKIGKSLPVSDKSKTLRKQKNYVRGCQSSLWLAGKKNHNDVWVFDVDSDIYYVKGIGKILTDAFNGLTTAEVLATAYHDFKPIAQKLSNNRQRGIQQMINHIHKTVHDY